MLFGSQLVLTPSPQTLFNTPCDPLFLSLSLQFTPPFYSKTNSAWYFAVCGHLILKMMNVWVK
eukprot:UN12952